MNKEKTDMLIYTTEDGLTKVETTFDGDFKELLLRNLAIKQMDTLDRINLSAVSASIFIHQYFHNHVDKWIFCGYLTYPNYDSIENIYQKW